MRVVSQIVSVTFVIYVSLSYFCMSSVCSVYPVSYDT